MTPLDYGTNMAEQMGIPGINLNPSTSAMTQLNFQNIRNLGANSNQPLITNQNDFQVFDSVTWIKNKHTFKLGGSVTWRSREILNADTIVGNFSFNNNMTSNCAGTVSGCTLNTNTGFDVASFLLGYATTKSRNLFDAATYTEKRPEYAVYAQDDFRVSSKLTLNLGVRYEVFVPWVEVDNRQSNFDESTGKFVLAADNAVINGVNVGRYLQTYSKGDVGPRFGFAYDVFGTGRTILRGGVGKYWNFTPGGTSSSKAQNPPFLQSTALTASPNTSYSPSLKVSDGLPPPPGVDPNRPPSGTTRSIFDINFRDGNTLNWNVNIQQQFFTNYMVEVAYAGAQGRDYILKGDPNEPPATVGVTNSNLLRPYFTISPALRTLGQVQSKSILNYHALLVKLQRRFANGFSLLGAYTFAKALDYTSDNDGTVTVLNVYNIAGYNYGPADYDIKHTLSLSGMYEAPWAREKWYGGWQMSGILYWRTGFAFPVTQTQGVQSTGTGNRPDTIGDGTLERPHHRQVVQHRRLHAPRGHHGDLWQHRAQHAARARALQHRHVAHQVHEDRPHDPRAAVRGVQRPQPPAVQLPAELHDRQRRRGHDHLDADQPGLLDLRHDGAQHPVRGEADVLMPSEPPSVAPEGPAARAAGPFAAVPAGAVGPPAVSGRYGRRLESSGRCPRPRCP